jgi:negative regulator of sigma E activity
MGLQVPTIAVGRTQFEIKQENTATTQTAILPPIKYEPPKIENTTTTFTQITQYQPPIIKQDIIVSMVSTQSVNYSLIPPTRQTQSQIEMPVLEGIKFNGNKSPVESAIETRPIILQTSTGQQTDTVKKNVQNNELAGGVSIEAIAKQPTNYAQYFTMIPDVAFYAPKEIYKNQKTIDNARALRLLSSDRLHQQMIDRQYKLGE